ncbi:TldD/PmbA family protein [Streptomyces sp. DT2A-34]|uniref:TldD/PmbA family protein n=1 Tax=Streptomyces sp. DT2A-34 TaxID=3051182 RepID=UPI00265B75D1|nr:TldD/PmbA family protein [Streptomyces sp. DT2A-34]MDO0914353.1 TldD/PmbA family protein [Streptomyces sp. DT2A-34]
MTWQADGTALRIARAIASRARTGEEIEAFVARGADTQILVRDRCVESVTGADSGGAGVRVRHGGRVGFAHTNRLTGTALDQVVADARENARHTRPSDDAVLPDPDGVPAAPLDLWREECTVLTLGDKVAHAIDLERLITASPRVSGVKSVSWGDAAAESAVVSSLGIESYSRRTSCFLSGYVLGASHSGRRATSTAYTTGRCPADLDLPGAAREAVDALPDADRAPVAPGRLPVLLAPSATAAFLAVVSGMLSRPAAHPDQALASAPRGSRVAAPCVTLMDDPTDPTSFGAARFDAEGLATRRNLLIDRGCAADRLHDAAGGRRAGVASNGAALRAGYKSLPGPGARALALAPGDLDPEAAVARLGHGFLVHSVTGLPAGADPLTGRFSVAVSGRVVRGGELAEHVPHTTLASTVPSLLQGVRGVGSDSVPLPGTARGTTLLVSELSVGGR